jgi:aspartate aminotransferase
MAIATGIKNALGSSSMIRKMFEEGSRLRKQHGADNVFDFSLGNPDLDPPPAFKRVLLKFAEEDKKGSHGYMPNAGFPDVREALAKKTSREQGVSIDASHIAMAVGAAGGLNTVFKTICNPGDEVIVTRPYFMEYRSYAGNHGAALVEVEALSDFNLDIDAIGKKLSPKTAAVLINSPNNPTGRVYAKAALEKLCGVLEDHGKKTGRFPYLVSDEPYREIAYNCEVPSVLAAYAESIIVNSYSKSLSLPGERIGYIAVGPQATGCGELMDGLIYSTRVLGFVNAPALMQRIVAELTDAVVDVSVYERRRNALMEIIDAAGIEYAVPEGAFYLFCKVPARKINGQPGDGIDDDGAFVEHLKRHLILAVPGSGFGKPGWLRIAYCVDEKIIRASASAFKQALEEW